MMLCKDWVQVLSTEWCRGGGGALAVRGVGKETREDMADT
jgi:hypothetical protein